MPGGARRARTGAGARVRRHRVWTRWNLVGRRALALRLERLRAARAPAAGAAAGGRGRDPRTVALRRRLPRERGMPRPLRTLAARPPEPGGERAAVLRDGPAVRRGGLP